MAAIDGGRSKPTLLLAEDNRAVAAWLVRLLREHFRVIGVVSDGETLLERVEHMRPDVIVTDIGLEGMDGISATKAICQRYSSIPVVVITGSMEPALGPSARAAGASAFVLKVEAVETLVNVLHSLLRRAKET